jgi:signal transduction histidine kinase
MKRPRLTSQTATRIAFGVVVIFLLAQVTWWIVFQQRYIAQVTRETLSAWQRDAATVNLLLSFDDESAIQRQIEATYPHLRLVSGPDGFVRAEVDPAQLRAFRDAQAGHLRMFAFEGPFYVLVMLAGLYFIALSLRAERDLKRRQQNFLSAVSHEFKTPLSTLKLLLESVLYRSLTPAKQRDYLERMNSELRRLEATSEQVLAAARLEHAPAVSRLREVDLNDALREALAPLQGGLEARGARLTVRYYPEPLPVSLDPSAFAIVLSNLLDNAVKYTPEAHKPVTIRLEGQRHLAVLHVEDQGVGLREGERRRIFDPFYRVGDELTRATSGVGLGLHLVRSVTEAMNGWVRCDAPLDPQTGRGSRFSVVLPKRVGAEAIKQAPTLTPQDVVR